MINPYLFFATVILLTVIAGVVRVFRGPTRADRMLSAQLCGTTIVAIVLLVAESGRDSKLYDVALVFALLTAIATVAFVRLIWQTAAVRDGEERGDA